MYVSLSTLLLNSRDQYEKYGNQILRILKHALRLAIFGFLTLLYLQKLLISFYSLD